jgi:hypothetical protein
MQTHKEYLQTLPVVDRPEAFGQHPNADISFQINDTRVVLESIVSLQPRASSGSGGVRREDVVMAIATDLLSQVGFLKSFFLSLTGIAVWKLTFEVAPQKNHDCQHA